MASDAAESEKREKDIEQRKKIFAILFIMRWKTKPVICFRTASAFSL